MLPVVIPAVLVVGLGGISYFRNRRHGTMTAKKQELFNHGMSKVFNPEQIRNLAKQFRQWGLTAQAELLTKRARIRELPDDVRKARREAYHRAASSKNKAAVLNVAQAFEREGCIGAAADLRKYAAGLSDTPEPAEETSPQD